MQYQALVAYERENGVFEQVVTELNSDNLPAGEVLIKVEYSSLNYKDALSATGNKGVTRKYPFTPGIDAAGYIAESHSSRFKEGDQVLVTGYDLGMNTPGGFGQYIRVPTAWVVPLPLGLSMKHAMIHGTAGYTAALALQRMLVNGMAPDQGPVLVTGATGGVGSISVLLLDHLGYEVSAATLKEEKHDYLRRIGASEIISSAELKDTTDRGLLSGRWAHAIDTVGGDILSTVVRSTKPFGNVAVLGLANSSLLTMPVFPFIIRGVNMLGVNSAETPYDLRVQLWKNLATFWKPEIPEELVTEVSLGELKPYIEKILKGKVTGRVVVKTGEG
ncbi:MAG: YhdH/YhfP family quinone oxidoreductase [Ignavibacteriaceae bacterium]|nr:YhdH/YhfP family quinone oxidoreductase [Ignavibacteriaceae bacterium]